MYRQPCTVNRPPSTVKMHIIAKQTIHLQIAPTVEEASIQHQWSELYWQDLLPEIDRLFTQYCPNGEVWQIDQLELDLGHFQTGELRKEILLPLLSQALEKWLSKQTGVPQQIQKSPLPHRLFDQWLFYLKNGYLPWSLPQLPENWEQSIIETLAKQTSAIENLRDVLQENLFAITRLIQQHKAAFLQQVVETYTTKKQGPLLPFIAQLPQRKKQVTFWQGVIQLTIIKRKKLTSEILIQSYLKEEANFVVAENADALNEQFKNPKSQIDQQGIFTQIAGIVLVHFFLSRFFGKLDLLKSNDFKDAQARSKAVHLLYYLATNQTEPDEVDLPLLKFLCGMPFNWPISPYIKLSEVELEEADALLQAVIHHWGALGKVSNASLQQGFLNREGKLVQTDAGWRLVVEKSPIDVVLGQLPWGIGIVKLPWMEEPFKVEWV